MACGIAVMQDRVHHLHSMYVVACIVRSWLSTGVLACSHMSMIISQTCTKCWCTAVLIGVRVTVLQTRLTALDLIGYAAGDERPRQFVHMPEQELDQELVSIKVPFFDTSAVYCTPMMPQCQGSSRA